MKTVLKRFRSPIVWLAVVGLIYSTILVPSFPQLPDWSAIAGYVAAIFGIVNNPADCKNF